MATCRFWPRQNAYGSVSVRTARRQAAYSCSSACFYHLTLFVCFPRSHVNETPRRFGKALNKRRFTDFKVLTRFHELFSTLFFQYLFNARCTVAIFVFLKFYLQFYKLHTTAKTSAALLFVLYNCHKQQTTKFE